MNLGVEVREEAGSRPASPAKALYTVHSVRPSTKYVEVEGPNKSFLRNALAPPRPVLPRKHESFHKPPNGIRERVPLTSSLKGSGKAGKVGELVCQGGLYKGEVLAGQPNGKGKFFSSQLGARGQRLEYEGDWIRGQREGQGTCYYYNGETYQGQLKKNQRHGQGRMQYSNGDAYEGSWVKDCRHGSAKYFYANGDVFVGKFDNNRREGLGTIYMARIGQKHTAEYRADKPLCGTWAEIDGRPGGSSVFPQVPIPKVHAIIGLLGADEGIAPMDELLKATLPASITPSVLRHLPELDVSQPDKVLQEVLSPLRVKTPQTTLIKAVHRQMSSFDQYELDRLRHAFVRLSGGDSRVAKLTPDKISDVCTEANVDSSHERTLQLCRMLVVATKGDSVSLNDFLRVINNFSDATL